jgi:hypothetical protein
MSRDSVRDNLLIPWMDGIHVHLHYTGPWNYNYFHVVVLIKNSSFVEGGILKTFCKTKLKR